MSAFTPSLLVVGDQIFDNEGAPETVIYCIGPAFMASAIAVAIDFKNAPGMREANAKRLVNCWNALDGLSDEALDGGWNVRSMSAYAKGLEENLRVARGLLLAAKVLNDRDEIADHHEGMPCTSAKFDELISGVGDFLKGGKL